MRVYVASSVENIPRVRAAISTLRAHGHSIIHDWTFHGAAWKAEHLLESNVSACMSVSQSDLEGVRTAEVVVVVLQPGRRGTHVEMGAALALGKRVVLVGHHPADIGSPCAFYFHPLVTRIADDGPRALLEALAA